MAAGIVFDDEEYMAMVTAPVATPDHVYAISFDGGNFSSTPPSAPVIIEAISSSVS
jgi:hypothetical protein